MNTFWIRIGNVPHFIRNKNSNHRFETYFELFPRRNQYQMACIGVKGYFGGEFFLFLSLKLFANQSSILCSKYRWKMWFFHASAPNIYANLLSPSINWTMKRNENVENHINIRSRSHLHPWVILTARRVARWHCRRRRRLCKCTNSQLPIGAEKCEPSNLNAFQATIANIQHNEE